MNIIPPTTNDHINRSIEQGNAIVAAIDEGEGHCTPNDLHDHVELWDDYWHANWDEMSASQRAGFNKLRRASLKLQGIGCD